jgi:hypothetical protein
MLKSLFLLCCAFVVSAPTAGVAQSLLPSTWKRLSGAPSPGGAEYACSGRTPTSWQVRFENGQLKAQSVEEYVRRRDDLPYEIDFSGAIDVQPPAPRIGGVRGGDPHAWAVTYARDHAGRQVVAAGSGWLVGFDAGEYGGSLWWYPSSPGSGVKLSDRNVRAIIGQPDSRSFVVLVGLSHMGLSDGAALTVGEVAGDTWKTLQQFTLRGAPFVYAQDSAGLVIVTDASVERLKTSGELDVLSDVKYESMSPHSVALGPNGEIAVGLRFFVDLLTPGQPRYRHQWSVPTKCTRFKERDRPFGCFCTGRD